MADLDEKCSMLVNRMRKNQRRLKSWRKRTNATCYRLFDRDIPELALTVDIYESAAVVAIFARDHEEEATLGQYAVAVADFCELPDDDVFLRVHRRQRGNAQYGRVSDEVQTRVVSENGLRFEVNLSAYLDTGLFLDHRNLRARVRDESKDKDVLNLFAYTGAFSVYAGAGGARTVTTVDMSNTYLDWARRNVALNGQDPSVHKFVRSDVIAALREPPSKQYDLIVCDPPSFSNSKKMDDTLDLQRDHAWIIERLADRTRRGGTIYFSTNKRRFRLDALPERFRVNEITEQSMSPDFRTAHRAWKIDPQ